jgi:heme/copper-type cytochrome/quinol oxidase subunit 2
MRNSSHRTSSSSRRAIPGVLASIALAISSSATVLAARPRISANSPSPQSGIQRRYIEIIADHDSQFRIPGQSSPAITVSPGEPLRLHITAIKAKNRNRDGAIHGFTLLRAKDHMPVPGWDLELHPGTRDYDLEAPLEPGEYEIVCTVICSANHENMSMKFIVLPGRE